MTFRRIVFCLTAFCAPFCAISLVPGQEAEDAAAKSSVRLSLQSDSRFGVLTYVADRWGELHFDVENSGQQPQELICASYVGNKTGLQFAREFWVPPQAKLTISHPILMPKADQIENGSAAIRSLLIERTPGNEVLLKDDSGQLRHERSLLVSSVERHTAVIAGWSPNETVPQDVLDLVIAARVAQGLNNQVTVLGSQFLPADEASLSYLDHIVIAENRIADDEAALAAVRRWLHSGGRLWVMLDRVDVRVMERLFGDTFRGSIVDRVGLNSVRIDVAPTLSAPAGETGEVVEFDDSIEMARGVFSGFDVQHAVDGWPASLTFPYGEGQVMLTTVGARAWVKPYVLPDPTKPDPRPPLMVSRFVPASPMEDLAAFALAKRPADTLPTSELQPVAEEFVSYEIPDWSVVIGAMTVFVLLLTVLAVLLVRTNRLEHFGWSGSLIAVVFGIALMWIGVSSRYSVPETKSTVQVVQAIGGSDDVRSKGVIGVYRQEGNAALIRSVAGGRIWPQAAGDEGTVTRLVTSDLGTSHWEGVAQQAGMQIYPVSSSVAMPNRLSARATLDGLGIAGTTFQTSGLDGDAILATRYGRIGVNIDNSGAFTAPADAILNPDQYLTATFLGDVQNRRQRILQKLFENPAWRSSLDQPHLLLWSKGWENGFDFGDGLSPQGETLLTVPVELTRPKPGTELIVPAPLIRYQTTRPPDGSVQSGCWDDLRGEWQERTGSCVTWLSFEVPQEILPIRATKALVRVKVAGAMGQIGLLGIKNGAASEIESINNPVGSFAFDIDDPEVLNVSIDGRVSLGVSTGVQNQPGAEIPIGGDGGASYWKIESLTLQLWGIASEMNTEN